MRLLGVLLNRLGLWLEDAGQHDKATAAYRWAIRADGSWSVPWFNLGLVYKRRRDWPQSLAHNEKAVALNPDDEGAWWNLGIAATALGRWVEARKAWRHCGISVPHGNDPLDMDLGPVPIRLNPDGPTEVVWCRRIDPARAVVENVPQPESGHRCGDLLLHDGAPNGTRVVNGVDVPVFDELQVLAPSALGTFIARVESLSREGAEQLVEQADGRSLTAEDWTAGLRMLCKACSEGRIDASHSHGTSAEDGARVVAFAASSEAAVRELLDPFVAATPGAVLRSIECAVAPAPQRDN